MAPKLNKLKLSPTKPMGGIDLDCTLHDVDKNITALKTKAVVQALGPIKKQEDDNGTDSKKMTEESNIDVPNETEIEAGGTQEQLTIGLERMSEHEHGNEIDSKEFENEIIKTSGDADMYDINDVPTDRKCGSEELTRTRMSENADEFVELSEERAREARIKQQLYSTSIRIIYVDRLNTTSLESQLHRAIYRGDEDEVRRVSKGCYDFIHQRRVLCVDL